MGRHYPSTNLRQNVSNVVITNMLKQDQRGIGGKTRRSDCQRVAIANYRKTKPSWQDAETSSESRERHGGIRSPTRYASRYRRSDSVPDGVSKGLSQKRYH